MVGATPAWFEASLRFAPHHEGYWGNRAPLQISFVTKTDRLRPPTNLRNLPMTSPSTSREDFLRFLSVLALVPAFLGGALGPKPATSAP